MPAVFVQGLQYLFSQIFESCKEKKAMKHIPVKGKSSSKNISVADKNFHFY